VTAEPIAFSPDTHIEDFVSGLQVRNTPEEREAVQPFSKLLVEDYGYPKSRLQTRPQYRVKARPSDRVKEYPVDIAVFTSDDRSETNCHIIVECKQKSRKDGRSQLEDYLRFSPARLGVWFNGAQTLFLLKSEGKGRVTFEEIPNIPKFGQRIEDVGQFRREDLQPASNLKAVFRSIRNYLAANAVGITRDEVFAQQIINLIFCKIYDERFTKPNDMVQFRAGVDEKPTEVAKRVATLFDRVKTQYEDVIGKNDQIELDSRSLMYVVGALQQFSLSESERDAVGEAFETFIGPSLKGPQGQFFTPRNVVQMVVDMIDPRPGEKVIDPACGSGGFLVEGLRHVWKHIEQQAADFGWPEHELWAEKQKSAISSFRGIDKDDFLAKVAKAYMVLLGDGRGGVFCENSLDDPRDWSAKTRDNIQLGTFDVVLTNPPYGKKLSIDDASALERFDLGHKWSLSDATYVKGKIADKQAPQILFIERCLDLLKDGGRMGIVLLESVFGMPKYRYVIDFMLKRADIKAVVTMPEDLFQPNTHAKTVVVVLQKRPADQVASVDPIFMCDVKWCGHDSRGNPTYRVENGERTLLDDVPRVAGLYHQGPGSAPVLS
jgi:type I restriction enzyme M protein